VEVAAVEIIQALMRFFSYLFQGLLALFLIVISGLAMASAAPNLHLAMLPWSGTTLIHVLFFGSIVGLLTVILAVRGTMRPLFFLWSLAVAILLLKGYVFSGYRFAPGELKTAASLTALAWVALIGAWFQMTRKRPARKRY
jgi:hypothetical protein